jgi:hypothetical protein
VTILSDIAPRIGKAHAEALAEERRGITRCWQYMGYHVYGAGPCFDTLEQAIRYRNGLDREGVTWRPQPR